MNAQDLLDQALKVKTLSDETLLMMREPEAYDLNVNGVRKIHVKEVEGYWRIWQIVPGLGMIRKYDRSLLDV